jgi:2,4-dienoyl-CoA reductase-like NADH-dependent reductase (Old Yellow Enzyme family)/thioredoxin reductase
MSALFPRLFSPLRLGPREARNRIVSTPHTTGFGVGGFPQARWLAYEREKARGGAGTIMMFGSASVHPTSPVAAAGGIEYWDPAIIPHLRAMADAIHEWGGLCLAQVAHWGRAGDGRYADEPLLAPSDEPDEVHHGIPRALTRAEIHTLIDAFGQAARHVKAGGYDGVDLSCWGGHLTEQFLSPVSNRRTDEYGGSLDHRLRFCLETLEAVRHAVGPDLIVGARLTGDQMVPGGLTLEDTQAIAQRLVGTGWLDYVTVSGASVERYHALPYVTPTYYAPLGLYNRFAAAVKAVVKVPVIVAGRVVHPAQAEEVLAEGWADAVAMTRALIADPEMPRKAAAGRIDEIRLCTGASEACIGRRIQGKTIACIQNAAIGREAELVEAPSAAHPRRVVVAGGGVAGLEAARMAARRGHRVILFEATRELGGQLRALWRAPGRQSYAEVVRWLGGEVTRAGVEVRLDTEATVETILGAWNEGPQAVVVATGARPRRLDAPVANGAHVVSAEDVLLGRTTPGRRVLVVDYQGHMPGPGAAEYLADRGHEVEIVTRFFSVGEDIDPRLKTSVYTRFYQKGIMMTPLSVLQEVGPGWARLANTLTNHERTVPADTVVTALGGRAENALERSLGGRGLELHVVGDALAPRTIHDAILTATRAARRI